MTNNLLGLEWQTLQQCHEQHEKNALLTKLVCVALCVLGLGLRVQLSWLTCCVLLLWAQEAIFKTYQSRIAERLLRVELLIVQSAMEDQAMQLHTDWAALRPGFIRLVLSYIVSACKPTVAFPYVPMLTFGMLVRS